MIVPAAIGTGPELITFQVLAACPVSLAEGPDVKRQFLLGSAAASFGAPEPFAQKTRPRLRPISSESRLKLAAKASLNERGEPGARSNIQREQAQELIQEKCKTTLVWWVFAKLPVAGFYVVLTHFLSGLVKHRAKSSLATKMEFPKSMKSGNSGSVIRDPWKTSRKGEVHGSVGCNRVIGCR